MASVGSDAPRDAGPAAEGGSADGGTHPSGAMVIIHVRATEAPFAHTDGLSAQTPRNERLGIAGLTMLTSASDPAPLKVYESAFVEAGLNDKEDTIVARVPAASLRAGNYTIARVLVTHARYTVAGTYHASGAATAGDVGYLYALSGGAVLDGAPRAQGYYSTTFTTGGVTYGPTTGNTPVPASSTGGITLEVSGGRAYYVFPISLTVDPTIQSDVHAIFELNTDRDFRWQDLPTSGYQPGIWDLEMATFEPVKKFGANSFRVFLE